MRIKKGGQSHMKVISTSMVLMFLGCALIMSLSLPSKVSAADGQDVASPAVPALTGYAALVKADGKPVKVPPGWDSTSALPGITTGEYQVLDGTPGENLTQCPVVVTPEQNAKAVKDSTQATVTVSFSSSKPGGPMTTTFFVYLYDQKGDPKDSAFSLLAGLGC
jgi:hypothetical protein